MGRDSTLAPLVARDVSKAYGDRAVLGGIELVANPGQPLGMVGENGVGKSTLLRLLAGVEPADSGSIATPADLGFLDQEPSFPEGATIGDALDAALAPLHDAVARLEELALLLEDPSAQDEYVDVFAWAELHDAWDADRRAELSAQSGAGATRRSVPRRAPPGHRGQRIGQVHAAEGPRW